MIILKRGDHGTLFQVMPSRDVNDGSIIVYGRPGNIKPEHFNLHRMYKSAIFLWEVLLLGDPVQIGGLKLVGNFDGISLGHVRQMDRRPLKLWGQMTGKTIPARI